MPRFLMDDDTIADTDKAVQSWEEDTEWNGQNHISVATGSQFDHETLYKSAKGRYYLVSSSQWQGRMDTARWLSQEEAAHWLLKNGHELPAELAEHETSILE